MVSLEEVDDKDRISNLPDHILTHILSFLPTKYAVGTSILSTRWKYLFTTTPILDFDDSLSFNPRTPISFFTKEWRNRFVNFVNRFFLLLNTTTTSHHVTKLRVNCCRRCDESHVSAWICTVLRRNVQELDICIPMNPMKEICVLPRDIFICKSLVVLKLGNDFVVNVPSSVCLPNLKVLSLVYITFTNEDSIRRVFSGCPVLEILELHQCPMENFQYLEISVPSLNSLLLSCVEGNYEIVLHTPILECFVYRDYMLRLSTVVNAHLALEMAKTVNQVNHVKFLHLAGETLEALKYSCRLLTTFHNLTHLELGVSFSGWVLPNLLERSPNLEVLVFVEGLMEYTTDETQFPYCLPEHVPMCLSQHLEEIEFQNFCGEEEELMIVEYFLKNGEVLKKMIIECESDPVPEWIPRSRERILMFPRSSQTCQIVVCSAEISREENA